MLVYKSPQMNQFSSAKHLHAEKISSKSFHGFLRRLEHIAPVAHRSSLQIYHIISNNVTACTIMSKSEGTCFFLYRPKPSDATLLQCFSCQLTSNLLILVILFIYSLPSVFYYNIQPTVNFLL